MRFDRTESGTEINNILKYLEWLLLPGRPQFPLHLLFYSFTLVQQEWTGEIFRNSPFLCW